MIPRMLAGGRRALLFKLLGVGLLQALSAIALILLVRRIFDGAIHHKTGMDRRLVLELAGLSLAVAASSWALVKERVWAERFGQDYLVELRTGLFEHLSVVEPRALLARSRGGLLLRFMGDLTALRKWISLGLPRILVGGLTVGISCGVLAWLDPALAGGVLLALVLGAVGARSVGASLQKSLRDARRQRARLATHVSEILDAMPVVQTHNRERNETERVRRKSLRLMHAMVRQARSAGLLRALSHGVLGGASVLVLGIGAVEVVRGATTPGTVVAANALVHILSPYVRDLAQVFEYYQSACISMGKLAEIAALPRFYEEGGRRLRRRVKGRIELRGVSVEGVFERVDLVIEPGARVALTGPNGAGKSTLLHLMIRLCDPDGGQVLIDGRNVRQLKAKDLHRVMSLVSPDLPLLRGSAGRNVRYRHRNPTQDELAEALELSAAARVLAELPHGIETRLSERGMNLSIGQRRRLALARAVLGTPAVLLLDEVEANLDREARETYEHILRAYPGTVVYVTHDREMTEYATDVWEVKEGRVLRTGGRAQEALDRCRT